ncbi:WD40-repeat-containing domain protein [Mycena metata]|uniref:WD40-repeat-containing domain protein n=1 Tax=Mycena metata TaxID=1033252 RepID=A0AAD7JUS9_9AGAR|nr:WD40-repeat-containing domain protein [Mycena metata]
MCFTLRRRTSKKESYYLHTTLAGHSGAITRLRASDEGKFLASAGTDGTKVWDVSTKRELASPKSPAIRGATTALVWVKREDDLGEALFYGTLNGYLVCWRQAKQDELTVFEETGCVRLAKPAEITSLEFDAPSNRLVVCHRGAMVQAFVLDNTMAFTPVFTLEVKNAMPQAVGFGQMHGDEREILVFTRDEGDIYVLRGKGEVSGERWRTGVQIGAIALDARKGVLCIDEPLTGANLFRLEDRTRVKTFPIVIVREGKKLRQVALLDECKTIVSGSDHGVVYVFDRRSGDTLDILKVHPHESVQTVAAADCAGIPTIFAAKSRDTDGPNQIYIWRKKSQRRFGGSGIGVAGMVCGMLVFIQLLIVVAAVAFVYQNFLASIRKETM